MPVLDREKVDRLKQILKWHPRGMTISDLATKMDTNRNLVAKYLDMLLISGQVEMEIVGAAKVYFLSHRVPISSMLEFSSDMVIVLDSEQKILQVNEPVLKMLKGEKEALVGRHLKEIDNPFFKAVPIPVPSRDSDTALELVHETECILEGKKHHFRVKQLQTAFEDGNQGITLIIEDISAQVLYQEMLEINEARYRGIVEDQTEFITRFLPDGKLIFVNDAYARYLGKKKEDLLGGPHIPNLEAEDILAVNRSIQSLSVNNPVITFECRIHHACGKDRWNLWTVRVLFDDEKKPAEYQGVGKDNTEKREAAARINQYIKDMEFLSRKAQEFVELSPDTDIFYVIGEGLLELLPTAAIVIDSYDTASDTLTVRAVFSENDRKNLITCLGRDMIGFQFHLGKVPEQLRTLAFSNLRTGRVFQTEEGLYDICFQQVPKAICDQIEETLRVKDGYYGIGLFRHGIFFGDVTFALRNGETLINASLIETYIHQASIVLHRRLSEEALKESEARYRGIVEDQTEFVTRFLPEGTLTYVNDSVCSYFQKKRGEFLGQSIFSLIPPDDQDPLIQNLHSLNAHNPVRTVEHRVLDPSGRIRWTQWTNRALFDDKGAIIEYQGVGRDITEQKEAEAKIRQYIADIEYLSQKSHEFLELPPDGDIYGTICRGVRAILPKAIVLVNSIDLEKESATTQILLGDEERIVFSALLGEDIVGKVVKLPKNELGDIAVKIVTSGKIVRVPGNLFIATQKQSPEDVCAKIEETLNIGDIFIIGLVSRGIILANVVIMLQKGDKLGRIDLIEAYIRQASIALLRCKTEQTLKKSESRYRGIVEDQTELVTRFLPDGTLTYVNDSVCRYFLKDLTELLGRSIFSLIPEEDGERLIPDLHSLNAHNPVLSAEHRVLDTSGRIRWTQWTNRALFDDKGAIIEYQGVGRDITEQREAEAKIRQYIADIEYISRTSYEFLELPPDADIYGTICGEVKAILPKAIVVVNSIDLKTFTATTRSVLGDEERDVFSTLMGEDIIGKTVRFIKGAEGDMAVKSNLSGRIVRVPGNLFFTMHRNVPEAVCAKIEETLNIGDIYTMGLISQGIIVAGLVILLRKGDKLEQGELIETYVRQASVALQRWITEKSLKKSEKLYRSVLENIQDVFYRSDKEGNLIMASGGWAKMLGYDSLEECIGLNIAEKFYFEPYRRKEILDAIYKNGSVSDYEVVLKSRDGSPVYVSTNSHLYFDDAGELLGVEGILRDISERRVAAEKIRNNLSQLEFFSRKMQEFIELSPDADIFEKIASDLNLLIADAMISVNSFNDKTGILRCRSCKGDSDRATCERYLGRNPEDIDYPVNSTGLQFLSSGRLHKVPFSLYDVLFGVIPRETCDQLVEAVRIGDIYGIGFARRDILFGNATIFLHKGAAIPDIQLIETYAQAASIALQRKIAEDSLKESQEIFSSVATYAPVPIAIIEPDGRYQFVNQKFIEIFGYNLNDFKTGKEWFSLAYPDPEYRKKVIAAWKSDLEASMSGQQRPEMFTVRCKNGIDREIIFRPVTLSDNKQCVVYEDFTERGAAEQVQKLLSSIVETSRDAIISKKIDGTIISWNKAAEQLYGYTKDEMIGRDISIIIPPERQEEMREIITRIKNGDSANNIETLRVCKAGRVIDVAVTVSPITNEAGIVIGASTIGRDISVRKAEERLLESEERYRAIVENMKIGVYRSTGDPKGRFVWGNTSLLDILGYPTFDTLRQIDVADLFAEPQGREKFLADLRQSGFVMNREIYLKRADGRHICVRVTALAKFNPAGDIEFINGTVEDITAYKQDSSELQILRHELVDIIDFLPDPTFIIDQNHQVIAWNSAMEHITGISKNEVIGSSDFAHAFNTNGDQRPVLIDLLDASDDEIGNAYSHVTREGSSLIAEGFNPSLYSGRGAYAWIKASPLYDAAGKKIGAIEIIRDISKVREIEESLNHAMIGFGSGIREKSSMLMDFNRGFPDHSTIDTPGILSPLYLSHALKMAQDYIAILDKSGKCLWVNDAMVNAVHAENCGDLAGKSLALFIAPEFRKVALNCLTDVRKNGHKIIPLMMLSSSGRIPVEANISPIMAQNGDFFGFIAIARITDREKIERPR